MLGGLLWPLCMVRSDLTRSRNFWGLSGWPLIGCCCWLQDILLQVVRITSNLRQHKTPRTVSNDECLLSRTSSKHAQWVLSR